MENNKTIKNIFETIIQALLYLQKGLYANLNTNLYQEDIIYNIQFNMNNLNNKYIEYNLLNTLFKCYKERYL